MNDIEIVVARYKEHLDWIPDGWKPHCSVYNKGEPVKDEGYKFYSVVENVGRESHTYLSYILKRYDSLPSIVVFTQADPFSHCRNFIGIVNELNAVKLAKNNGFFPFGWSKELRDLYPRFHKGITKDFRECHRKWIGDDGPRTFKYYMGAIFAVSKSNILSHSREYYQDILKSVSNDIDPVEGYCLERLWGLIFSGGVKKCLY